MDAFFVDVERFGSFFINFSIASLLTYCCMVMAKSYVFAPTVRVLVISARYSILAFYSC
jgi:hypothetical protein